MSKYEFIKKLHNLFEQGKHEEVNKLVYDRLLVDPSDEEVRKYARKLALNHPFSSNSKFLCSIESLILRNYNRITSPALRGWQYTAIIDHAFFGKVLKRAPEYRSKRYSNLDNLNSRGGSIKSGDNLLADIITITTLRDRWKFFEEFIANCTDILEDSFIKTPKKELEKTLFETMNSNSLNVIILGAGCTGLALANSLKVSLGHKVNVLIIDTRTQKPHIRRPYSRDWLTNIPSNLFSNLYDPLVKQILQEFGEVNYLGAKINLIETLFLYSNKMLGVKFLFSASYNIDIINHAEVDLVIDATGGKIDLDTPSDLKSHNSNWVKRQDSGDLIKQFQKYGINKNTPDTTFNVQLGFSGNYSYPIIDGKPLTTAMLKITSIPAVHYEVLIKYISEHNYDNLFYIWPGRLITELNEILVFINLDIGSYEEIKSFYSKSSTLSEFIKQDPWKTMEIEKRIKLFFEYLSEHCKLGEIAIISPPFLYDPYLLCFNTGLPRLYNKPIIPIGDSIFCGNPKVSNGLESHLAYLRFLHDTIIHCYLK